MRQPHVDDVVRLTQDIPELSLNRGEVGVVRSTWFSPSVAYEVEFRQVGHDYQTRALLLAEQVIVEDGSLFDSSVASLYTCLRTSS
jgi:Domain of unknown function (DUF4926)